MVTFSPYNDVLVSPHRITYPERVEELIIAMKQDGWQGPPLIGYKLEDKVQLLSGTHRYAAAIRAEIMIPVLLWPFEQVWNAWGDLKQWKIIMGE